MWRAPAIRVLLTISSVVEVGVQGVVALGNGEAIQVEVGVGVQNSGVIGAQTPYAAIRLVRAGAAENVATPDGGGVVVDPNVLAVDGDAGFRARAGGVLSGQVFLLHLGDGRRQAA